MLKKVAKYIFVIMMLILTTDCFSLLAGGSRLFVQNFIIY